MKYLIFIAALAASPLVAEPEIRHELSYETGFRDAGRFDVNRAAYNLAVKQTWEKSPLEFASEVRAFSNFSHAQFGLTENSVQVRNLRLAYWGNRYGAAVGLQQISWSETFGYQPVDVVNARDFRDYSPLDHGRNRLPAWNGNAFFSAGPVKVTGYLSPQGQVPGLPASYQGRTIHNDDTASPFFTYPEGGVRASTTWANSNASVFAYRHLSRVPAFLAGAGGTLNAFYRPVQSYGATFSRGFSEVVIRADGVFTQDQPVSDPTLRTILFQNIYSATAGVDWSPAAVDTLTVGLQGQIDRFAVLGSDPHGGLSLSARKDFWDLRLEVEAKAFTRFRTGDYWLQLSSRLKLGDAWEWKVGGEALGDAPDSPTSLLGYKGRVWSSVSVYF